MRCFEMYERCFRDIGEFKINNNMRCFEIVKMEHNLKQSLDKQ